MNVELSSSLDTAKRSCNRCFSQQNFKPSIADKDIALKSTRKAKDLLVEAFDDLRSKDAPVEQIQKVRAAKTICLDAIDACNECSKASPRIKEILLDLQA
ncbi:MAG: hypothetical protein HON47_04875 [Candidatus Diapherotrites archaeon]|jgi:hypothetical protein|uniref:Uncharacterized protein n=1 Tax=Candidatus Iainarchaeum sp. TaxID=3101447 RepID=A0A8T5GFT7_9ARCH|nr:hypothetical protein [Candidatus Diapherotrites archaeon]MBT7241269.1 hypothetical protein [Candidatus Diapherotrites archaeon]